MPTDRPQSRVNRRAGMSGQEPAGRQFAWIVSGIATLVLSLCFFIPFRPQVVAGQGLDESWMLGINALFARHLQFGRDVVFTYGPWGFLDTCCYHPDTWPWMLGAWGFFGLVFWRVCWMASRRHIQHPGIAFIWMTCVLALSTPHLYTANPALLCMMALPVIYYFHLDGRAMSATSVLLAGALALASLVKFTFFVSAMLVLATITADQLRRRRLPSAALLFGTWFIAFWLMAGQHISSLPGYLSASMQIAGFYPDAMSCTMYRSPPLQLPFGSPPIDLAVFLAACISIVGVVLVAEWWRNRWASIFPLAACAALLSVPWKAGFVRHDAFHVPVAALVLLCIALLMTPVLRFTLHGRGGALVLAAMLGVVAIPSSEAIKTVSGAGLASFGAQRLQDVRLNFIAACRLAGRPWLYRPEYDRALAMIREESPIPPVRGSVDIYPWQMSIPVAYGLDYSPRPVFQSYFAYSPKLAQMDADYLTGPSAPDTILFAICDCSLERVPAADDGLSWPLLLTRYDLADSSGKFLVLRKSPHPRDYHLSPLSKRSVQLGSSVSIPPMDQGPVWVQIKLDPTGEGRLLSLAYKNPEFHIILKTQDGREHSFRLPPGEAEAGFLLSPLISDNQDFTALSSSQWRTRLAGEQVRSIVLETRGWVGAKWAYRPTAQLAFSRLNFVAAGQKR